MSILVSGVKTRHKGGSLLNCAHLCSQGQNLLQSNRHVIRTVPVTAARVKWRLVRIFNRPQVRGRARSQIHKR